MSGHWELRYNMQETGEHDTQQSDDLHALFDAARDMANPWEIRRASDGQLVYAETEQECDCGRGRVMRGWRCCLTCAESSMLASDMWGVLYPPYEQLPGVESVQIEFIVWDIRNLRVARTADAAPKEEQS